MELSRIREQIKNNPSGVRIVMANGREFAVPHRDYVTFSPEEAGERHSDRNGRSFYVWEDNSLELVNAMLVVEVTKLNTNGHGKRRKKSA